MAILIGLAIPLVIIIIIEVTNTKVRGRKDLESLTAPIIGEIPQIDHAPAKSTINNRKGRERLIVAVEEGSRNIINEAFRVLRTNIEFMTREKRNNVIIFTSFNPGSGKTFCILNTAISLAIKKEDVLLIDGDMRHASLSNYVNSPEIGLSNYLAKETDSLKEITVIDERHDNLHIIPVGTIPPNPTELLESSRFADLIEDAKKKYTYILIDCPPVEIVADTQIIEKFSTNTFFLVRTGLMERSMINELEELYTENKFKSLSVIITVKIK
jgi:capsular exopolysaccharide synthesis family protein